MTSKYEGFPLALIETMSHGVPPISYNCKSGPKETICDGIDGLLVPFNNKIRKSCLSKCTSLFTRYNYGKMDKLVSKFSSYLRFGCWLYFRIV